MKRMWLVVLALAAMPAFAGPTVHLDINPQQALSDEPITVKWSSPEADHCKAEGVWDWDGARPSEGTQVVHYTGTKQYDLTFTLTCFDKDGHSTRKSQMISIFPPSGPGVSR